MGKIVPRKATARERQPSYDEVDKLRAIFLELDPEPLPSGWEKCLDLNTGVIYFKDWNTGTKTCQDPRRTKVVIPPILAPLSSENDSHGFSGISVESLEGKGDYTSTEGKPDNLELSLNAENACTPWEDDLKRVSSGKRERDQIGGGTVGEIFEVIYDTSQSCVCTVEKIQTALTRGNCNALKLSCSSPKSSLSSLQSLSLNLPSALCRESHPSRRPISASSSSSWTSSSSQSSSASAMSFQGDDESSRRESKDDEATSGHACRRPEVAHFAAEPSVMVTFGCKQCFRYFLMPKVNRCCPKCGCTALVDIAMVSEAKRQKVDDKLSWRKIAFN